MRRNDNSVAAAKAWGLGQIGIVVGCLVVVILDRIAVERGTVLFAGHSASGYVVGYALHEHTTSEEDSEPPEPPEICSVVGFEVDGAHYQLRDRCESTAAYELGAAVDVRYRPGSETSGHIDDAWFIAESILLFIFAITNTTLIIVALVRATQRAQARAVAGR